MKSLLFFFTALTFLLPAFAAAYDSGDIAARQYREAFQELRHMLEGKAPLSYERALFRVENAFHNNTLDSLRYRHILDTHTRRIRKLMDANRDYTAQNFRPSLSESITLQQARYEKALANWAIFAYMTDTTYIGGQYAHLPFHYSFQDPLGTLDWTHTQVTSLLSRGTGNCFALASLFRIFSERLDSEAALCTAPGHIYIRHADHKGVYYNVEVSTRSFAGTGSIATLTYTTDEAVRGGIALRALDTKQSVALCLVYLAKGYLYSQSAPDDSFAMDCAELALRYDSLCLSALLLKAEALENRLLRTHRTPGQWRGDKDFAELESLTCRLYRLGYRQMPLSMKEIIIGRLRKDSTTIRIGATDHTPQPFRAISTEQIPYATLSWGRLEEMHADQPVERYGRTLFDTRSGRITGFARDSVFFNDYFFDPVVFAWQIDPLAHKYPGWSPYTAFENNPIYFNDPSGKEAHVAIKQANGKTVITISSTIRVRANIEQSTIDAMQYTLNKSINGEYSINHINEKYQVVIDVKVERFSDNDERLLESGISPTELLNPGENYVEISSIKRSHADFFDMKVIDYNAATDVGTVVMYPSNVARISIEDANNTINKVIGHEFLHLLGIADRYYDFMSDDGSKVISGKADSESYRWDIMGRSIFPLNETSQLTGIIEIAKQKQSEGFSDFILDKNYGVKNYNSENLSKKSPEKHLIKK